MSAIKTNGSHWCAFAWTAERPVPGTWRQSNTFSFIKCEVYLQYSVSGQNYCVQLITPPPFPQDAYRIHVHVETTNGKVLPISRSHFFQSSQNRILEFSENQMLEVYPDFLRDDALLTFFVIGVDHSPEVLPVEPVPKEENSAQYSSYISCLESLATDQSGLLQDRGSRPDVVLFCGDRTGKGHGRVPGARPSVLSAMLHSDMSEVRTGHIEFKDMHYSVFDPFVRYLDSGTLPELSAESARGLYEAADEYDLESLMRRCVTFLEENLAPENACEMLVLADAHSDQDFKEAVKDYVLDQGIFMQDDHWLPFCKNHPLLANEVFISYVKRQRII